MSKTNVVQKCLNIVKMMLGYHKNPEGSQGVYGSVRMKSGKVQMMSGCHKLLRGKWGFMMWSKKSLKDCQNVLKKKLRECTAGVQMSFK